MLGPGKRYKFLKVTTRSPGLKQELLGRAIKREVKTKQQLNELKEVTNGMARGT